MPPLSALSICTLNPILTAADVDHPAPQAVTIRVPPPELKLPLKGRGPGELANSRRCAHLRRRWGDKLPSRRQQRIKRWSKLRCGGIPQCHLHDLQQNSRRSEPDVRQPPGRNLCSLPVTHLSTKALLVTQLQWQKSAVLSFWHAHLVK